MLPDIRDLESVRYLAGAIGEDSGVEWITAAEGHTDDVTARTGFLDAVDVYRRIGADTVTWLWSVAPATTGAVSGVRALRHPEGWLILIDVEDPEFLWVEPDVDVYRAGSDRPVTVVADGGSVLDTRSITRLASVDGGFDVSAALSPERISAALGLWVRSMIGSEVGVAMSRSTPSDRALIESLAGEVDLEDVGDVPAGGPEALLGAIDEAIDIVGDRPTVGWCQTELVWQDVDGETCFPGAFQVHTREADGSLSWLVEIAPVEDIDHAAGPVAWIECDGWEVATPIDDPTVLFVPCDRMVFAAGRGYDTYEALGVAVPLGTPPPESVWSRLGEALAGIEQGAIHRSRGWSESRVSRSLESWFETGAGRRPGFVYDADDPVSRQANHANAAMAENPPRSAVSAGARHCMFERPDALPFEVGARCPNPDEFHYRDGIDVVFVCSMHVPPGVSATPVIRR